MAVGPKNSSINIWSYLKETSLFVLVGHTIIFIMWAFIGIFAYDAYRTMYSGRSLTDATLSRMIISGIHIDSFMKTHGEITDLLAELRLEAGASRAVLVLFTNGKASVGGVPYIHASSYAESHDPRLPPSLHLMQDLDISFIPDLPRTLEGQPVLYHPDDAPESIRHVCLCLTVLRGPIIRTFDGKPHGYIFLTWEDERTFGSEECQHIRQRLNEFSFIFAGVLSTVDIDRMIAKADAKQR